MSQKTNPVSLRLQKTNKSFSSCWYSEFFYDQKLYHDFKIRSYIETVAEQVGHLQMLSYLQIHYKRSYMHLFFSDKRGIREEREKSLKILRKSTHFFEQKIKLPLLLLLYNNNTKSKIKDSATQENKTQVEIARLMAFTFAHSIFMYQSAREKLKVKAIGLAGASTAPHLHSKHTGTRPRTGSSKAGEWCLEPLIGMETCFADKHSKGKNVPIASAPSLKNENSIKNSDGPLVHLQLQQRFIDSLTNQNTTSIGYGSTFGDFSTYRNGSTFDFEVSRSKKKESNYPLYFQFLTHTCWKDTTFVNKTDYKLNGAASLIRKAGSACKAKLAPCIARITAQQFRAQNISQLRTNPLEVPQVSYSQEKGLIERPPTREKEIPFASILRELQTQPALLITPGLQSHHFFCINPIRIVQDAQSAAFLANEIVHLIQKGVSFRLIKDQILRNLTRNVNIKGVRFSCSGRIGGRSKKAQKTKKQSIQWGETSLHVFSSKLSFAKAGAATPFGKVGIKVWVCYK